MKRLFEVNGEFFSNKIDAKVARGEPLRDAQEIDRLVNGTRVGAKLDPAVYRYAISIGPDHWRSN